MRRESNMRNEKVIIVVIRRGARTPIGVLSD